MAYYLGIDGGGTKTTCAVGDESRILATVISGPSNIVRVGEATARESLQQGVQQACVAAGILPQQVARTCVGGSGAARPELAETVRRILAEILATPVVVVGDMEIALEAAFDSGPGVVVIAGTGSIAFGRDADGKTARAGGWGFAIGDEGSAHWIGREAVHAVLQVADRTQGRTPSHRYQQFVNGLFQAWGVNSLADLARMANTVPPPNFAALFPAVAASSDLVANEILSKGARELAEMAAIVAGRLFPAEAKMVGVATVGGVFAHAPLVRGVFDTELRRFDPRVKIIPQVVEPVEGALRIARRAT